MTSPATVGNARAEQRRRLRRRFLRRPTAVAGLIGVVTIVSLALLAPLIVPFAPEQSDFASVLTGPSAAHLFGTDELGRDVLSRVLVGARASLLAGIGATALAMVVAIPIGLVAGYYRGLLDTVFMRATDVMLAFPFLILSVGLAAILGPSLRNAILALAVAAVPGFVRITRAEVLGLRELEYVQAAVVNGAPDHVILSRHILRNCMSPLVVQASIIIPTAIIGEAALSYLGLGVQPPTASWGTMLATAQSYISETPSLALFPGAAIAITTLSFNLLGDGLRDVLDPKGQA